MAASKLEQNYAARAEVELAVGAKMREITALLDEAVADPDLYRDGLTASLERIHKFAAVVGPQLHPEPLPEA